MYRHGIQLCTCSVTVSMCCTLLILCSHLEIDISISRSEISESNLSSWALILRSEISSDLSSRDVVLETTWDHLYVCTHAHYYCMHHVHGIYWYIQYSRTLFLLSVSCCLVISRYQISSRDLSISTSHLDHLVLRLSGQEVKMQSSVMIHMRSYTYLCIPLYAPSMPM